MVELFVHLQVVIFELDRVDDVHPEGREARWDCELVVAHKEVLAAAFALVNADILGCPMPAREGPLRALQS